MEKGAEKEISVRDIFIEKLGQQSQQKKSPTKTEKMKKVENEKS